MVSVDNSSLAKDSQPTVGWGQQPHGTKANSAFHTSGVSKWVPASAGKARQVWFIQLVDERGMCR